jgi:thioredoxin reductase
MPQSTTSARPRVVVVGAGFGGLEAARRLARSPVDVTVIDRHNNHLFQPLLYQVATAALSPADIAEPIRIVLRHQQNATVLLDEVIGVDTTARQAETRSGAAQSYDYLVLATGSQYTYFGHNDWPRLAPGLKSIDDATLIRRRVLLAFEEAETVTDPAIRQRLLTFVLVGAGPTGVEMAGALAELAHPSLSRDFRNINPHTAHILLVEAGPRVLSGFPDKLADFARRSLERMGVDVLLDTPIEAIDRNGVLAGSERTEAANVIWCAGVEASPMPDGSARPPARAPGSGSLPICPSPAIPRSSSSGTPPSSPGRTASRCSRTPDWFKRPFLDQAIYEYNPRSRLSRASTAGRSNGPFFPQPVASGTSPITNIPSHHITPAIRDNPAGCQTGHPAGLSESFTFSRVLPDQHPVTPPSRVFVVAVLKLVPRGCRGSGRSAGLYSLGDAGPSVPAREFRALRHCGGKVCGSQ